MSQHRSLLSPILVQCWKQKRWLLAQNHRHLHHIARNQRIRFQNARSATAYFSSSAAATTTETDVLIVGGGAVGCALADVVQHTMPHVSVGIVEAGPARQLPTNTTGAASSATASPPHPRSYALSPASLQLLRLTPQDISHASDNGHNHSHIQDKMGFYDTMQVWEEKQPAYLSFSLADLPLDAAATSNVTCLGAVVEDRVLVDELLSRIQHRQRSRSDEAASATTTTTTTTIWDSTKVAQVQLPAHAAEGLVQVQLQSAAETHHVRTKLLVAADGAQSQVRSLLGIRTGTWDYGQTALTCTVELASSDGGGMNRRAFQRFLSAGPLALLPTHSKRHAIVVWSTTPQQVNEWKQRVQAENSHASLIAHWNRLLQQGPERLDSLFSSITSSTTPPILANLLYGVDKLVEAIQYGPAMAAASAGVASQAAGSTDAIPPRSTFFVPPPTLTNVSSPLLSFPLTCRQVTQYTAPRVALIGDAAHSVHPFAGQGLNLGLLDVAALVTSMQKADDVGMDVSTFVTSDYERSRQAQVTAMVQGMHALHAVFGHQDTWAKHVKSLGMNLVQNATPLRSWLVQMACQGVVVGNSSGSGTFNSHGSGR